MRTSCPACGFDLGFEPWAKGVASFEICPCCGIQFGYDDAEPSKRAQLHVQWRQRWIAEGMPWWSGRGEPSGWNALEQVRRLVPNVSSS